MKLQTNLIGLITVSTLFTASSALAASLNLSTWEKFGDVEIVNPNLANLSNNALLNDDFGIGLDENYNFSNNPAINNDFFDLEIALELTPGTLDLDSNNFEYAYEGSAIQTTVEVKAGTTLNFDWNFFTNESSLFPRRDYVFFLVNQIVFKLADFQDISGASTSTNYARETGLQTYNYNFASDGIYTIALGVVDIGDYNVSSGLSVGNVILIPAEPQETKIPESNSLIGFLGLFTFGLSKLGYLNQNSTQKT